jgi:hypothetical protein
MFCWCSGIEKLLYWQKKGEKPMTTFISLATSATMFPAVPYGGTIITSTLTPELVQRRISAGVSSALNPSHASTIDAIRRRYGLELALPVLTHGQRAPQVKLNPGDELFIVQAVLPRLNEGERHSDETVANAPINFLRWRVPVQVSVPAPDGIPQSVYNQMIDHAYSITLWQRGEAQLKNVDALHADYLAEIREFDEAYDAWKAGDFEEGSVEEADLLLEWADMVYKMCCLRFVTANTIWSMHELPARIHNVDTIKGIDVMLAKYGRRAAGLPKDVEAERALVLNR